MGTMESSMSKAGLDNRHRNKDDEISHKHGNTLIRMLRKYGQSFAAGYPETEKLSEVLLQLNEASLSQLRRDHETRHRSKRSHVRSGSETEVLALLRDVRLTPQSRHQLSRLRRPFCAISGHSGTSFDYIFQ